MANNKQTINFSDIKGVNLDFDSFIVANSDPASKIDIRLFPLSSAPVLKDSDYIYDLRQNTWIDLPRAISRSNSNVFSKSTYYLLIVQFL